ncbi:hypothetical protein QQX98_010540 [Neonectria punicea]|uniref:Uncharacterized protein n=1 Tax=Neonectria punicea TaxID=979145 RepID=A0ABR1GP69_9HYPO
MPHEHVETEHKWRYMATKILFTCKRLFEEGIPVLHKTNTLVFESPRDLIVFQSYAAPYLDLVKHVNFIIKANYSGGDCKHQLSALASAIRIYPCRMNLTIQLPDSNRHDILLEPTQVAFDDLVERDNSTSLDEKEEGPLTFLAATILGTCKQAYVEGIAVLYSTNTLIFDDAQPFLYFKTQAAAPAVHAPRVLAVVVGLRQRPAPVQRGRCEPPPHMFYEAAPCLLKMLVGSANVKAEVFVMEEQKMKLKENMGGYESDLLTLIARGSCLAKEGDDLD